MEVLKLVQHINRATDEDFDIFDVIGFINDGIAKINIEVGANFPFIEDDLKENMYRFEEYTALPESWQRQLLIPYGAGRIKENDSSQFEYLDWYGQFNENLARFKSDYVIPEQYLDKSSKGSHFEEDHTMNMFSPLRGW